MRKWTRRSLFTGAGALAATVLAFGAGKVWCRLNPPVEAKLHSLSPLLEFFPEAKTARMLGQRYLQQVGSTANRSLAALQANDLIRRAVGSGCRIQTMLAVQEACCEDFRAARIHCIDGWVLAQTELDIAALFTDPVFHS